MAADNMAQSAAITQISTAIGAMDQSTQQNAAMVEETSAAARNLSSEVGALAEQAARFNVGGDGRVSAARTVVRSSPRKPESPVARRAEKPGPAYVSPVTPLRTAELAGADADWNAF
jgi:methyl-accepting chemotaxis protein